MFLKRILAVFGICAAPAVAIATGPAGAQSRVTRPRRAISAEPDRPVSFGYKIAWFAIRTVDTARVSRVLELGAIQPANWQSGVGAVYEARDEIVAFVAPPVDGWTLVVTTLGVAAEDEVKIARIVNLLRDLSKEYGEAQHFGTYWVVDYHAWFRAVNGELQRGFSWCAELDGVLTNLGTVTEIERELGFGAFGGLSNRELTDAIYESEGLPPMRFPDEDDPQRIAGAWSIDPQTLDSRTDVAPAVGLFGTLPGFAGEED